MDINCWIFLVAGVLVAGWAALAKKYRDRHQPLPPWLAPDWIFGDPTCDPNTAPLTLPARCAVYTGALIGGALAFALGGIAVHFTLDDLVPFLIVSVLALLFGWFGYRGANRAARYVMVRRATPIEVFMAGAAGAVVAIWFISGAGSGGGGGGGSSSSGSSKDSDRSSGGGSFGGGGASGKW
jgi:hypothetical protein